MCHLSPDRIVARECSGHTYRSSETVWIEDEIVNDFGTNSAFVIIV